MRLISVGSYRMRCFNKIVPPSATSSFHRFVLNQPTLHREFAHKWAHSVRSVRTRSLQKYGWVLRLGHGGETVASSLARRVLGVSSMSRSPFLANVGMAARKRYWDGVRAD